jgi:hypothetical protein
MSPAVSHASQHDFKGKNSLTSVALRETDKALGKNTICS